MSGPPPTAELLSFTGRRVLVTGGARGLGRAIAHRFAMSGAAVAIADLRGDAAAATASELQAATGTAVSAHAFDQRDPASIDHLFDELAELEMLDVLVNNAGVFWLRPSLRETAERFREMYATNVDGLFRCSQRAIATWTGAGRPGTIVNVASINPYVPSHPGMAAYDSSKAAVIALTQSMAKEFGPAGIRINAVAPGAVDAEALQRAVADPATSAQFEEFRRRIPLGRFGDPDEHARAVLFLASDAASYVTGTTLIVDGGRVLG